MQPPRDPAFERWLVAHGHDPRRIEPQIEAYLRACYDAERQSTPPAKRSRAMDIRAAAAVQTSAPAIRAAGELAITGRARLLPIEAAEAGGAKKPRRFEIVAYTGEPMQLEWWDYPVVVDLAGIDAGDGILPILDNHGPRPYSDESMRSYFVGQSETATVENGQFVLRGIFFDVTDAAKEILALADAGAKWQASIGARATQRDFVAEGNTVEVNGRTFEGPIYVARRTKVRETSIVVTGADGETTVVVARGSRSQPMKVKAKAATFSAYCEAQSIDEGKLTEQARAALQAVYDAEDDDDDKDAEARTRLNLKAKNGVRPDLQTVPVAQPVDVVASFRKEMAAEETRCRELREVTAGNASLTIEVNADGKTATVNLREHAIAAGWDRQRTADAFALADLRAQRAVPSPHFYSPSTPNLSGAVLEAAVLQTSRSQLWDASRYDKDGVPERIKRDTLADLHARYTDQVQQAAHTMFKGRIGLQQLLCMAASANGRNVPAVIRDNSDLELVLRSCNWDIRAAGDSTISIQNVLANVLNKRMLEGYIFAENTYRLICGIASTKDFKPTKAVNIFGDFVYQKTNASGELQAATMTDEGFTNQVDTFGRLLSIPRPTIINDDIQALTTVPMLLGIGAVDRVNILVWTLWLSPGNGADGNPFWFARNTAVNQLGGGAAQSNLITGAGSALTSASLQTAKQTYDKQVKPNGQPLGWELELLLHPPELDQVATELMVADTLVGTGQAANSRQPNTNIWKGRFKRGMSRYLSNSTYTGYSTTAWWLLTAPERAAAIELAFLNGQETPTVQTAQADFDRLGIMTRGFFDVGANMQNYRAGVKSNGA